jgi:hypothetical protein
LRSSARSPGKAVMRAAMIRAFQSSIQGAPAWDPAREWPPSEEHHAPLRSVLMTTTCTSLEPRSGPLVGNPWIYRVDCLSWSPAH